MPPNSFLLRFQMRKFVGSFDPSLIAQNQEDFDRRYIGTWLNLKINGVDDIFHYTKNVDNTLLRFNNPTYGDIVVNPMTEAKLEAFFPPYGLFNGSLFGISEAVVCYKRPERINKRSCNNRHVQFRSIVCNIKGMETPNRDSNFYSVVKACLNPIFPKNIEEAIAQLKTEKIPSIALNREYALLIGDDEKYYITNGWTIIGRLRDKIYIHIDRHFAQEFSDYLRDTKQKYTVERI